MRAHLLLLVMAAAACHGRIGDTEGLPEGEGTADPSDSEPAFSMPDQQPQLLPFWVRLERVAAVVDRPTDDPMFSVLLQNRLALGDYDYASGIKPDRLWSPTRMALWGKSLKPVCGSEAMHTAYPELGTSSKDVVALASKAWGRTVAANEIDLAAASLTALDDTARYEAVCLAVLSSAEMVIQ